MGALGVLPILIAIPAIVGLAMSAAVAVPRALVSSVAFVLAKVFDYSLFRATKEMLYLPLDAQAKTVGKSYVDMGTYRAAKAVASLLLLALVPLGPRFVGGTIVLLRRDLADVRPWCWRPATARSCAPRTTARNRCTVTASRPYGRRRAQIERFRAPCCPACPLLMAASMGICATPVAVHRLCPRGRGLHRNRR